MSNVQKIILELEQQRAAIERAIASLRALSGNSSKVDSKLAKAGNGAGKHYISAEGRARIAEAQRRRWKHHRAAQSGSGALKANAA